MDETQSIDNHDRTDRYHPLTCKSSTTLASKMKKKYDDQEYFIKEGTPPKNKKFENANIGHLSNKQLKKRFENLEIKVETNDKKKKKNINGKVGINKDNNYIPDKFTPKKVC